MNRIERLEKIIANIERILEYPVFRDKKEHPVVKISRTALIRELMWADQLLASMWHCEDNDDAMGCMTFNSRIVDACAEDLRECMQEGLG